MYAPSHWLRRSPSDYASIKQSAARMTALGRSRSIRRITLTDSKQMFNCGATADLNRYPALLRSHAAPARRPWPSPVSRFYFQTFANRLDLAYPAAQGSLIVVSLPITPTENRSQGSHHGGEQIYRGGRSAARTARCTVRKTSSNSGRLFI